MEKKFHSIFFSASYYTAECFQNQIWLESCVFLLFLNCHQSLRITRNLSRIILSHWGYRQFDLSACKAADDLDDKVFNTTDPVVLHLYRKFSFPAVWDLSETPVVLCGITLRGIPSLGCWAIVEIDPGQSVEMCGVSHPPLSQTVICSRKFLGSILLHKWW